VAKQAFLQHSVALSVHGAGLAPLPTYNSGRGFGQPLAAVATGDRRVVVLDAGTGVLSFFSPGLVPIRTTTPLVRTVGAVAGVVVAVVV
jgi:hypothetical protein